MRVVLVHGIRTDGTANIDRVGLLLTLEGYEVVDVKTPIRNAFTARFSGRKDAALVADVSHEGDILVSHSYGSLVAWHAHKQIEYSAIWCIGSAISKHVAWRNPSRVFCYHSNTDRALLAGSMMVLHPFGRAGMDGFTQVGVNNIELHGFDHNDYFSGSALVSLTQHIDVIARTQSQSPPPIT